MYLSSAEPPDKNETGPLGQTENRIMTNEIKTSEVCGKTIKTDLSGGQGHCWKICQDIPADIAEEIAAEIIDGRQDACADYLATNGQHYSW